MFRILGVLVLVGGLAACDTGLTNVGVEDGQITTMAPAYGDGTIVTENDVGVSWTQNVVGTGSSLTFVNDFGAPASPTTDYGQGALLLTTENDNQARAELGKAVSVPLADVGSLSYWTYQPPGNPGVSAVAYKMYVTFPDDSWTFLVFEPYWQNGTGDPAPLVPDTWRQWASMEDGNWWSSKTAGGLDAGFGGPPFYSIADVLALQPNAVVGGIQLGIGSYNPDWSVAADGMRFANTLYNFEPFVPEPTVEDCRDGGYEALGYRNLGQCIAFFKSNENSAHHD